MLCTHQTSHTPLTEPSSHLSIWGFLAGPQGAPPGSGPLTCSGKRWSARSRTKATARRGPGWVWLAVVLTVEGGVGRKVRPGCGRRGRLCRTPPAGPRFVILLALPPQASRPSSAAPIDCWETYGSSEGPVERGRDPSEPSAGRRDHLFPFLPSLPGLSPLRILDTRVEKHSDTQTSRRQVTTKKMLCGCFHKKSSLLYSGRAAHVGKCILWKKPVLC